MTNTNSCYMTFSGASMVLKAERLLRQAGIGVEAVGVPRHISTDCGICINLAVSDRERVFAILKEANMEIDEVYNE